ncbi:hypothetical protein ACP70R_012722 [Stipagrostis hirtigluma subsp. patula]
MDMDSTDQIYRSPLLQEDDSLQKNIIEYTGDGSVCIRGCPASKKHTGKWKACSLTIVLFILLVPGLFFNCKKPSQLSHKSPTRNKCGCYKKCVNLARNYPSRTSNWSLNRLIADSYLGKYWTALIFFTIYIIGMMILVMSATLSLISSNPHVWPAWTNTVSSQHMTFFIGLYMVAIGFGAQSPCVISFGADQFDDTDGEEKIKKSSFFNWHHFIVNAVFFDKAAIVTSSDCESVSLLSAWRICTVTQVEEFKILVRMLPIWATTMLFATVLAQMFSTFVEQGMLMDKHIGSFEIPAASFQSVDVVAVLALVPAYERIFVPVSRKFTGTANGITSLQRMGIGLFLSVLSLVSAALVESNRLQIAQANGLVHRNEVVPMSILWQGPQYFLIGAGEVFSLIGLTEFFYEQSPDAMRSLCVAFSLANMSAGNYLSSLIVSLVPMFTAEGGSPGWTPDNLNEGHLD